MAEFMTLIKHDGKIKTLVDGTWVDTGLQDPPSPEEFQVHGIRNLGAVTEQQWAMIDGKFEVLVWTDDESIDEIFLEITTDGHTPLDLLEDPVLLCWKPGADEPEESLRATLTAIPHPELILASGDLDISNAEELKVNITGTEVGNSLVRAIVSFDQGETWYSLVDSEWVEIDVKDLEEVRELGMSMETLNGITQGRWAQLRKDSNWLRFGYYLELDSAENAAETDRLELTVDMQGTWRGLEYDEFTYGYLGNRMIMRLYAPGDYKINYYR